MNSQQAMVRQFHHAFGSTIGRYPQIRDRELAVKLIMEEAAETAAALGFTVGVIVMDEEEQPIFEDVKDGYEEPNFEEAIDGLADLLYVTYGAAIRFGIDIEPFFAEVHAANMAKQGGTTRADGKIIKPEGWKPPNIKALLDVQRAWGPDPSLAEVRHERLSNGERP